MFKYQKVQMTRYKKKIFLTNQINVNTSITNGEILAGGILFVKYLDGVPYVLLIKQDAKDTLEDLGGRTDPADKDIFDTITREVNEESNDLITFDSRDSYIEHRVYVKDSKYLCIIVKITWDSIPDTTVFGSLEKTDNLKRTINWYRFTNKLKSRLNFRIRDKTIYDIIKDIGGKT